MQKVITHSPEETLVLGERLGHWLETGDIVLLFGDLGSGKTTLTQGICRGLGLPENEYIRSPSFTLINEYAGTAPIYHIDLYRLDSAMEVEALGLEEILFGKGVCVVEWAEKLSPSFSPKDPPGMGIDKRMEIHITIQNETDRMFEIEPLNLGERPPPLEK
ncbi:ATP-binding protein [Candidatus Nitromaritima sp. SCGC AAA799-C22]|nr:ATP-binding protein [Candidatus Nitromaritima sp. SCGC AAA799-C22]